MKNFDEVQSLLIQLSLINETYLSASVRFFICCCCCCCIFLSAQTGLKKLILSELHRKEPFGDFMRVF